RATEEIELARQHGRQIGGGMEGDILQSGAASAVISAPAIPAALIGGLPAAAVVGGATSMGASAADAKQAFMEQGLPEDEAERRAAMPAIASGAITTAVTSLFGRT